MGRWEVDHGLRLTGRELPNWSQSNPKGLKWANHHLPPSLACRGNWRGRAIGCQCWGVIIVLQGSCCMVTRYWSVIPHSLHTTHSSNCLSITSQHTSPHASNYRPHSGTSTTSRSSDAWFFFSRIDNKNASESIWGVPFSFHYSSLNCCFPLSL